MTAAGKEPPSPTQGGRTSTASRANTGRPASGPPAPPRNHAHPLQIALAALRRHWPLLSPLAVLLPLSIFTATLWQWYFRDHQLPGIAAAEGAVPCAQFVSSLPQRAPRNCAVAIAAEAASTASPAATSSAVAPAISSATSPAVRHELFYFDDDSVFAMLLRPGAQPLPAVYCNARSKQALIVLLGLILIGVATISNKLRTGRFFSFWPIRASPLQPHEILLLVYGAAILMGGIVGTQITSCAASEHAAAVER